MLHGSTHIESSDVEARAKTLYNKLPGVLTFTNTRILWTKDGHSKPTVNLAHSKLTSLSLVQNLSRVFAHQSIYWYSGMFSSKAGVPKKRLKLLVSDQPYQFSFTSPPAVADAELEKFKSLLAAVVSSNTSNSGTMTPSTPKSSLPKLPGSPPTPSVSQPSPIPYSRSSSAGPSKGGRYSFEVYQKVLTKNPELADLHGALVESGQVTEHEFWEGREVGILIILPFRRW